MSDVLKLKYKVGEIEFEAEGPAEAVEQQRVNFMNAVLPAAVEAMVRTQTVVEHRPYIESASQPPMIEAGVKNEHLATTSSQPENDFSRTSLASFLKKYGALNEQDFTLFAAFFDEQKNGNKSFSIDDVKKYYAEARRPVPTNPSMSLNRLAEKGYIMDAPKPEDAKNGKYYMLTTDGIAYIDAYVPKEGTGEKKKARPKTKTTTSNVSDAYKSINADDLNLKNYPAVKSLSGAKEQVIMAMYIVTNEGKGEWFTVDDVIHMLINVFEVSANTKKVGGVFDRNKGLFASEQDPNNKKAYRRKLLSSAKDFALEIIANIKGE